MRKQILAHLTTFKDNECEDNMPAGVLDFISCIRKKNMNVKNRERQPRPHDFEDPRI